MPKRELLWLQLLDISQLFFQNHEVGSRPIAAEAEVELKMEADESLPVMELDASRFSQILVNLIVNAIQASSSGEEILVKTRRSRLEAFVEIADCGCGIAEGEQEKIFQPFFSTRKEGTGLGLAIVKKIVEAHGGRITFHPNKDKGTTFVVALPSLRPERRD